MPGTSGGSSSRKRRRTGSRKSTSRQKRLPFTAQRKKRKPRKQRVTVPRGKLGLPKSIRARVKTVSTEVAQISHSNGNAGVKPYVWSITANDATDLGFHNNMALDVAGTAYQKSTSNGYEKYKTMYRNFKVVNAYAKVTFAHAGNFGATVMKTTNGASQYRICTLTDHITDVVGSGPNIGAFQSIGGGHIGHAIPPVICGVYASKDHGRRYIGSNASAQDRAASSQLEAALQGPKTILESDQMKHSILMPGGVRTVSMNRSTKSFYPLSYNTEDTQGVTSPLKNPDDLWYFHVFCAPMNSTQEFEQLNITATIEIVQDVIFWDAFPPIDILQSADRNMGSAITTVPTGDDMESEGVS